MQEYKADRPYQHENGRSGHAEGSWVELYRDIQIADVFSDAVDEIFLAYFGKETLERNAHKRARVVSELTREDGATLIFLIEANVGVGARNGYPDLPPRLVIVQEESDGVYGQRYKYELNKNEDKLICFDLGHQDERRQKFYEMSGGMSFDYEAINDYLDTPVGDPADVELAELNERIDQMRRAIPRSI